MDGGSFDFIDRNIYDLKILFPDVFVGDKIDFEKLKSELQNDIISDDEFYNFTWFGKTVANNNTRIKSTNTLLPCVGESISWDDTNNIYIEGDNLEVLKILQKSYMGKIRMIYLDPPYNTGNDFVYPDNFADPIQNYRKITGQTDSDGNAKTTNSDTNGRFHTNWLNMMYPRLKLARNLLTDDGVIVISIDDHELCNLKKICDELFGDSNFVSQITLVNNIAGRSDSKNIATAHEYILIYQKSSLFEASGLELSKTQMSEYKYSDDYGKYRLQGLRKRGSGALKQDRPNMWYPIYYSLITNEVSLTAFESQCIEILPKLSNGQDGRWRWGKDTFEKKKKLLLVRQNTTTGDYTIDEKVYLVGDNGEKTTKMKSFLLDSKYTSDTATTEYRKLMGKKYFENPKSVSLLEDLIKVCTKPDSIIMDLFSGSGTTAEAVMKLNYETGSKRSFIMVQIPELLKNDTDAYADGYRTICDLGKERIKRAGLRISDVPDITNEIYDVGFKVFKLNTSNIKKWQCSKNLKQTLLDYQENIIFENNRTELDIVFEILLKLGLKLTLNVDKITFEKYTIFSIGSGSLMICLDDIVDSQVLTKMISIHEEFKPYIWKVVFRDNGFLSDDLKINFKESLKSYGLQEDSFLTL